MGRTDRVLPIARDQPRERSGAKSTGKLLPPTADKLKQIRVEVDERQYASLYRLGASFTPPMNMSDLFRHLADHLTAGGSIELKGVDNGKK